MKSFLEKSKRALVLLLTGAMIATSVPSNALAATVADDADDVIIEEAVDAAEEAVITEEPVADATEDAVESLAASDEETADPDVVDPDNYTDDVQFVFLNATAGGTDKVGTFTHVRVLDLETRDCNTGFYGWTAKANLPATRSVAMNDYGYTTNEEKTPATASKKWDSSQDYTFILEAEDGYVFNTASKQATDRDDLKKRLVNIYSVKDASTWGGATTGVDTAVYSTNYTVELSSDFTTAVVTINKGWLKNMRDKYLDDSSNYTCPAIVVAPIATLYQFDANKHIRKAINVPNSDPQAVFGDDVDEDIIDWGWGVQPDTYNVAIDTSYPAKVNADLIEATYNNNMPAWDCSETLEITYKPITGVEIYVGDDPEDTLTPSVMDTDGETIITQKDYTWTHNTHQLTILAAGVNNGYKADKKLTVKFLSNAWEIHQENVDVGKNLGFYKDEVVVNKSITGIDKSLVGSTHEPDGLEQGVLAVFEGSEGRDLGSIDVKFAAEADKGTTKATHYLLNNKGSGSTTRTKAAKAPTVGAGSTATYIPRDDIGKDMWIYANTAETVTYKEDATLYTVDPTNASRIDTNWGANTTKNYLYSGGGTINELRYSTSASVATIHPYTGEAFTLPIAAAANHKITKVQFIGDDGTKTDFTDNLDGTFTVAANVITQAGEIKITSELESGIRLKTVRVYTSDGVKGLNPQNNENEANDLGIKLTNIVIRDSKYGLDLNTADTNAYSSTAVPVLDENTTKNPNFYFTVRPKDVKKHVINKVSWRVKSTSGATFNEIQPVRTGSSLYMIPNPGEDIEILVELNDLVTVTMPTNKKATVTIPSAITATDGTILVQKNRPMEFTVSATNNNIEVTEIGANIASAGRVTVPLLNSKYTIAAGDVKGNIVLYAQTVETINDGTDNFWVKFAGSVPDTTYGPAGNFAFYKTKEDGTPDTPFGTPDTGKELRINQNTSVLLTPSFCEGTTDKAWAVDGSKTTYTVASGDRTYIKVAKPDGDATSEKAKLEALKDGADKIGFTVTQKSAGGNKDENLLKITGEQDVTVTPHFEIAIAANGHTQEYVDSNPIDFAATVTNGATQGTVGTNGGVVALIKGTPGITDAIAWSSSDGQVTVTPDYTSTNPLTTTIKADNAEDNPFELTLKITDTDEEVYVSNVISLWPVDYRNYIIVPELTISGGTMNGGRYFGTQVANSATAPTNVNYMGIDDLNKATLKFKVYEGNKETTAKTLYTDIDTEVKLEEALSKSGAAQKWASEVESGIEWSYVLGTAANPYTGLSVVDKGNGEYELTAAANAKGDFNVKAVVNHMNVNLKVKFNVCNTTEMMKINMLLDDAAQTNKNGTPVNHKLKGAYTSLWKSENDLANKYKGNAVNEDGYQFKIVNGSQFTLPTENDLDPTIYKDHLKARTIVGWLVEENPGTLVGALGHAAPEDPDLSATPAGTASIIDRDKTVKMYKDEDTKNYYFFAPGATIVALNTNQADETYNTALGIYPVWADRYKILAETASASEPGVYVDNGYTQEIKNWSVEADELVPVTVPRDTVQLSTLNTPGDITTEKGLATQISKSETAGMNIAPVALKAVNAITTVKNHSNATVRYNRTYPVSEDGEGTVEWFFYDYKNELGGNNYEATDYPHIKAGVLSADETTRMARKTVLDETELKKGNLVGKELGQAIVYATYTDKDSNVFWLDRPILVTVAADQNVNVTIGAIKDQAIGTAKVSDGIEVGQEFRVAAGNISVDDGGAIPASGSGSTNKATGKYTWNIKDAATGADSNVLEIFENPDSTGTNADELTPIFKGVAQGDVKVSLTYTAANGVSATSDEIAIKVKAPQYSIDFTDKDGNPVESIEAQASKIDNNVVGKFYVTVKDGTIPTSSGAVTFESSDPSVLAVASIGTPTTDNIRAVEITAKTATPITLGTAKITATFTINGKTYKKTVPVNTYYAITFGGGNAGKASDMPAADPFTSAKFTDASKSTITNDAGAVLSDENGVYVLKIFKQDLTQFGTTKGYTASLDNIQMKYSGVNSDKVSFIGWSSSAAVNSDETISSIKVPNANNASGTDYAGNVTMFGNFGFLAAQSLAFSQTKIVLDAAGNKVSGSDPYRPDAENLRLSVGPKESNAVIKIKTSSNGIFKYTEGAFVRNTSTGAITSTLRDIKTAKAIVSDKNGANDGFSGAKLTMTDRDTTQDYELGIVTIDNTHAGMATLTAYSAGTDATATVDIIVKGLYTKDGKTHYMSETGDLKNSSVTIGDDIYFFDESGDQIKNGIAINEAGKTVIVKNGKALKGYVANGDIDGHNFYADETDGSLLTGKFEKGGKWYYADPTKKYLSCDEFVELEGKLYYFDDNGVMKTGDGKEFTTIISTATSTRKGTFQYLIGADGAIAGKGLVPYGTEGKYVLINDLNQRVTAAMAPDGKYDFDGKTYTIDSEGYAKLDKEFFYTGYTLSENAWSWNDGAPTVTVTMNYVSADGTDTTPTETLVLNATTTDPDSVTFRTYTATTTAKFVKKGETEKKTETFTKKYDKDGKSAEYTYKSHKFDWAKELGDAVKPTVTAKVTYSVKEDGVAKPDETIDTTVGVGEAVEQGAYKVFTATLTTIDGLTKTEDGKYNKKTGKLNDTGESGTTPSESEDSVNINLFYTDIDLSIPSGDWTTEGASGKWTTYYKVNSDGSVEVIGDRKKAATAANSLIVLPVKDSDDNIVGEFEYQLPVSYEKPSLKLSSTSATIKSGSEQTVSTIVTEKKSNGLYEPIDVTSQDTDKTPFFGAIKAEAGDALGQVDITTSSAAKGKIAVQLDNWSDKVELAYTVKAVDKDVLTASAKQVIMNTNVKAEDGEAQEVTIKLNNGDIDENSGVAVTMPKDSGVVVEGIENGKLTSSTLTFKYGETALTKGNYTYKFSVGKASVSVKLVVSNKGLDSAVALGVKTKMNLMTGQKMVVVPTLKGIGGPIEDVAFDSASAELFEVEYNDEINQIIIAPVDATKLNPKTKYDTTLTVKAGGVDCPTKLKIQLDAKKPTVKIAKVTIPKANLEAGTGEGVANILSTYKVGGKTFAVAPTDVKFTSGSANSELGDGWYTDSKTKVAVKYNAEDGTISVKALSGAKAGAVKVDVYFGTEKVGKTLAIKKGK